jgi:hypothetical protein
MAGTPPGRLSSIGSWPGVRAFRSAGFRSATAVLLLVIGVVLLGNVLVEQASDQEGQYAFDFQVYHAAARDIAGGGSPYAPEMLSGPIPAQGALLFKYPPVLAQLLAPLSGLAMTDLAAIWLIVQLVAILAGVWLAARAGGARSSVELLLWSAVAAVYFLPNFDTVWKGNVSGIQAGQVGLMAAGGVVAGAAAASIVFLKTTPVVMLPAVIAAGGRMARALIIAGAVVLAISFALSPAAWLAFVRVIPNLIAGSADFPTNLAPASVAALAYPDVPLIAFVARAATFVVGLAAALGAVVFARRPDGWHAALTLAVVASVVLPSAIWYHYLAVMLPVAALAWHRASPRGRALLVGGSAVISVAVVWLPLALGGVALLTAAAITTVWPRAAPAHG